MLIDRSEGWEGGDERVEREERMRDGTNQDRKME